MSAKGGKGTHQADGREGIGFEQRISEGKNDARQVGDLGEEARLVVAPPLLVAALVAEGVDEVARSGCLLVQIVQEMQQQGAATTLGIVEDLRASEVIAALELPLQLALKVFHLSG